MAEFDLVAPVYDTTRHPPSAREVDVVAEALGAARSVVEGGVGTGRFALLLEARGFRITGADLAQGMLRRAREKGLLRLLRADLHRLPFREGAFEGALIVHVLQLVPDPFPVLAELARVATDRVVAHLPDHRAGGMALRGRLRERYAELALELGHPLPSTRRYWDNSERVLRELRPAWVREVEEEIAPDRDPEKRWRDLRTFGGLITVPPELHARIVERLRRESDLTEGPGGPTHRTLRIAAWNAPELRRALATR